MTAKDYLRIAKQIEGDIDPIIEYVSQTIAMIYNGMPTLAIRVKGITHKGWVYVSKDIDTKLVDIQLLDAKKKSVINEIENVQTEILGKTIAKLIE